VSDGPGGFFFDLGDLVQPVVGDRVGVGLGAGAVVGDVGQVAVRVIGVGEVGLFVVDVGGVVADELDRVRVCGAKTADTVAELGVRSAIRRLCGTR
jgi:hypothetical protein